MPISKEAGRKTAIDNSLDLYRSYSKFDYEAKLL
jgi:hypothetical protein